LFLPRSLRAVLAIVVGVCLAASRPARGEEAGLTVWPVDPLVKVFRDATPAATDQAVAEVARGEHATFQLVVQSAEAINALRAEVGPLTLDTNRQSSLQGASVRLRSPRACTATVGLQSPARWCATRSARPAPAWEPACKSALPI